LIVPAALTFTPILGPLASSDDVEVAFTPIVRLSLDSLRSGGTIKLSYVVPSSPQWDRIRNTSSLGDNGYIVLVADTLRGQILPFTPLGLDVSVSGGNTPLVITPSKNSPFMYQSATGGDVGLQFTAAPGALLQFAIKARNPEGLPPGELIVQPYWYWVAQDIAEIGRAVDSVLKVIVTMAARIGLILLVAGVALQILKSQILKS